MQAQGKPPDGYPDWPADRTIEQVVANRTGLSIDQVHAVLEHFDLWDPNGAVVAAARQLEASRQEAQLPM